MRNIIFSFFLIFLFTFLGPVSAHADFYKYIDQDGNVRYTDDLNMVPEDQRTSCAQYQGYEDIAKPPDPALKAQPTAIAEEPPKQPESGSNENGAYDFNKAYQQLEKKRTELDLEYKSIAMEKQELAKEKQEMTAEEYSAHNQKIKAFNEKVKEYNKKKADFEGLVLEYNKRAVTTMEKTVEEFKKKGVRSRPPKEQ